jgi:hypothetical protein
MRIAIYGILISMLLLPGALWPQNSSTAEIVGTVTDPSGAVIPHTTVKITNTTTGTHTQATTNMAGVYDAPFLDPGPYTVEFQSTGFQTVIRAGIQLQLNQTARVDAQLKVGSQTETVTVNETAILNSDDSQRGTNFNQEMIEDLPTVGRDASYLALLAPGTSSAQSNVSGVDPGRRSVNGSRAFSISATVNGGSGVLPNSDNFVTLVPALSTVSEFNVIENNYNAEYATGTSVLNIITKTGTNQFHGSAFEYFENNVLNARNFFAKGPTPLRYNQPGGTIGGPVIRNKLFFFFSYQNTLNPSTTVSTDTVPTAAVRGGNLAGLPTITDPQTNAPFPNNAVPTSRFDPAALKAASYWPAPNQPGNVNNFYFGGLQYLTTPIYDVRGDYRINDFHTVSAAGHVYRLNNDHTGTIPGPACFNKSERCGVQVSHSQQWTLSERWIVSPSAVNVLRINFVRQYFNQFTPNQDQNFPQTLGVQNVPGNYFPFFSIGGAVPTSIGPGQHSGGAQSTFSYGDALTVVHGKHSMKFGGEFDKFRYNVVPTWDSGSFTFSGLFTGVGYADFLLGEPFSYSLSAQPNTIGARRLAYATFAQDDYHVTRRLTLNLGLRYEGQGGFSEVNNRLSNFSPTLINPATNTPGAIIFASSGNNTLQNNHFGLFAPRVGLAYSPGSGWVVRGGYGIFFVPISAQRNYNSTPPGYAISQSLQVTNQAAKIPIFLLSQGPPPYQYPPASARTAAVQNGQSVTYFQPDAPEAYMQQWHLSLQKQISSSTVVEASYVASKGTHLLFPRDLNQVPRTSLGPGNLQLLRPYPQFQSITTVFDDANSNYNALQVKVNQRFSRGLTFLANYTYSKSLDTCSLDLTTGGGCEYQISTNPGATYAPSQFDQKHRVVIAGAYELPFGAGRTHLNHGGIVDAVIGGWRVSESFTANSGFPFSVFASTSNPALSGNLFANVSGTATVSDPTLTHWFNTSAFSNPAPYTFGNSGRDLLRGPGFWDFDLSLNKKFVLPIGKEGRYHIAFRADFYNTFNHTNFAQPNATVGSAAMGTITATAYSNPNNNPSRQIQLGAVVRF